MSSTFGKNINISIFGESHGACVGVTLNNIKAGLKIDYDFIKSEINRRKPISDISTPRKEEDEFEVLSGVFNGFTTGSPITIIVKNNNTISKHYDNDIMRPSHADYSGFIKYNGFNDYRGGGHFSGRITLALVIAGAICKMILSKNNIKIESHIYNIGHVFDIYEEQKENEYTYNTEAWNKMKDVILEAKANDDSIGGSVEAIINGLPVGVGEPFFDSVESILSHLLFSIPAVKGVEFGLGSLVSEKLGSEVNDAFMFSNDTVVTTTNNNGGINGGITNGMPITVKAAFKPTPSIKKQQQTINLRTRENIEYSINGRHDPCIVPRALVVVEAAIAIGILDLYLDYLGDKGLKI